MQCCDLPSTFWLYYSFNLRPLLLFCCYFANGENLHLSSVDTAALSKLSSISYSDHLANLGHESLELRRLSFVSFDFNYYYQTLNGYHHSVQRTTTSPFSFLFLIMLHLQKPLEYTLTSASAFYYTDSTDVCNSALCTRIKLCGHCMVLQLR